MTQNPLPYEKSFERLEKILEMMNSGKIPLEDSLKLYEEAENLIRSCTASLNTAEQKIELLIKGRNGELSLDTMQTPQTEPFR